MNVALSGAGRLVEQLLPRLGKRWSFILMDVDAGALTRLAAARPVVARTVEGDPSSPMVLKKAGLTQADFILVLAADDAVNLATASFAARVGDPESEAGFRELGVHTLLPDVTAARTVSHYLSDTRIMVRSLAGDAIKGGEFEVARTTGSWVSK